MQSDALCQRYSSRIMTDWFRRIFVIHRFVLLAPVLDNGVGGASQPFQVNPQLFQRGGGEILCAPAGWATEGLEQSCLDENGNVMGKP